MSNADANLKDAVRAFTLNYGDPSVYLDRALEHDPGNRMAILLKAWILVLSNDGVSLAKASKSIADLKTEQLNYRENAHLSALQLAANNQWPSAVSVLDRHLMEDPHDLAGHQCALRLDGYQGRFHREAARAARALPFWSKNDPSGSLVSSNGPPRGQKIVANSKN